MNKLFKKAPGSLFWISMLCVLTAGLATYSEFKKAPHNFKQAETKVSYEKDINKYLKDYTEAALKANYVQAEQVMRKGIADYPGFAPFYYNLFMALDHQGKTVEAKSYLQQFLQMMPYAIDSDPEIQYNAKRYGLI